MKLFLIIISVVFTSCSRQKEIHIMFENAGGLTKGSNVYMKGIQIGRVHSFLLLGDSVEVIARIVKEIQIYKDSEISIKGNLYGVKSIDINPGDSKELIDARQKLYGYTLIPEPDTASLKEIKSGIQNIFSAKSNKQDSILIELRRINKSLDSLKAARQ